MISLLIVDDISSTRENLQKLLSFEDDIEVVGTAADGREGLEAAHRLQPDIVLTDVNMPLMDGIQLTETLASELPTSPVIIMSVQGERDYLRRAMQAGAREFLIKPFSHDELVAAIRRVYQLEQKKGTFIAKSMPVQPAAPVAPRSSPPAEIILVFSGKGGVGKTLIATNLAVALADQSGGRVALVDLDLQFGDIGVMLNLDHSRSITELVDGTGGLDADSVAEVLASGPGGVKVLLAPISPELADLVTAEHIRLLMAELRRSFDYVIVDSSTHLTEFNLEVIEIAQRVLVVTALTIPAIKDAKLTLKVLESLSVDPETTLLVVNRVDGYADFNRESIEQSLRVPVAVQIPHDPKTVGDAITRGAPFVTMHPDSEVSRAMRELVARITPEQVAAGTPEPSADRKKRKGIFGR
ncbi:MAG: response regulator [Candidatus Dormibacteraeota bacterium]|uniref:Response regulator n=1 Tax=Candidatus Amunia macphersoniae TaxID=3127014 RepID=A0A934KHC7_9BACT|nr:response regulator [Candidatus Dormibacteraeota bacterium]